VAQLFEFAGYRVIPELNRIVLPNSSNGPDDHVQLRKALGDDPRQPTFIETIPRRGYRFLVECRTENGSMNPTGNQDLLETQRSPFLKVSTIGASDR